ncbi:unnamed protein product [Urochloa decumbens]|uniref:Uncharacterized protein n=1 Tax=Urochloa decumbens TaxID=240449 RepID=A0ABC9AWX5_9POAL
MCVLTLLFTWLTARTLQSSSAAGALSAVLWAMSPPICAYLFSWTIALNFSGATDTCAAVVFLATLYSAATLGRAIADRRQRAGNDQTAAAAAAATPSYQSRGEVLVERHRREALVYGSPIIAAVISTTVSLVLWYCSPLDEEDEVPIGEVGLDLLVFVAGPWLAVTGQQLLDPLMAGSDTMLLAMVLGLVGWIAVAILAAVGFGTIAAVLVIWAGALGMAGFLGYCLVVEAHYRELMVIKRSEARVEKDASGLLDGRDVEDACSDHIDAATIRCPCCALPELSG